MLKFTEEMYNNVTTLRAEAMATIISINDEVRYHKNAAKTAYQTGLATLKDVKGNIIKQGVPCKIYAKSMAGTNAIGVGSEAAAVVQIVNTPGEKPWFALTCTKQGSGLTAEDLGINLEELLQTLGVKMVNGVIA